MRLCFRLILLTLSVIIGVSSINAESIEIPLLKMEGDRVRDKENGNRLPARRVMCTIGDDGVRIDGYIAEDDILSYEVWDASGEVCVASFADERDFINGLKLMYGDYQVRFAVADYLFIGYITL